jgi:hypothetical protein
MACLVGGLSACGGSDDSSTEAAMFTVSFPSFAAAVATDSLQVSIFDAQNSPDLCHELVRARTAGSTLPSQPLVTGERFTPCQAGQVKLPPVTFGDRALLVVGESAGKDVLIGCQHVTMSAGQTELPIPLALAAIGTEGMAPTTCRTLRDHCDGRCR